MNVIKCKIAGCTNEFKTEEAVSKNASYICKDHPRMVQVLAVRPYDPHSDNVDANIRFQEHQFDKELTRGGAPQIDWGDDASKFLNNPEPTEEEFGNIIEID